MQIKVGKNGESPLPCVSLFACDKNEPLSIEYDSLNNCIDQLSISLQTICESDLLIFTLEILLVGQ